MATPPRPRHGLVLLSAVASSVALLTAATVSAWALVVVPAALVIGGCAWRGLGLSETWHAIEDATPEDLGRGPAGMSP